MEKVHLDFTKLFPRRNMVWGITTENYSFNVVKENCVFS